MAVTTSESMTEADLGVIIGEIAVLTGIEGASTRSIPATLVLIRNKLRGDDDAADTLAASESGRAELIRLAAHCYSTDEKLAKFSQKNIVNEDLRAAGLSPLTEREVRVHALSDVSTW